MRNRRILPHKNIEDNNQLAPIQLAVAEQVAKLPSIHNDSCNLDLPEDFLHPSGLLGLIMALSESCSVSSHPLYNLAGAINLVGHIAGQQVKGPTGLRTNFYCIIIGYSGSGKEAPARSSKIITSQDGFEYHRITDDVTSGSALLRHMERFGPVMFLIMDEMGRTLDSAQNRGSTQGDLVTLFMKLFTKTDATYEKTYAKATDCFTITGPHLNILGQSTENEFYQALAYRDISSGFIPRCLFFPSNHQPQKKNSSTDSEKGLEEIVRRLRNILTLGNNHKPMPVSADSKAESMIDEFSNYCHEKSIASYKDPLAGPVYARMFEHGMKLCLIHAVSRWDSEKKEDIDINSADCNWGFGLAKILVAWLAETATKNFTGADKHAQLVSKIYKCVKTYQQENDLKPCPTRHLYRKLRTKAHELQTGIQTLLDSGEIIESKAVQNRNKTTTQSYSISEEND